MKWQKLNLHVRYYFKVKCGRTFRTFRKPGSNDEDKKNTQSLTKSRAQFIKNRNPNSSYAQRSLKDDPFTCFWGHPDVWRKLCETEFRLKCKTGGRQKTEGCSWGLCRILSKDDHKVNTRDNGGEDSDHSVVWPSHSKVRVDDHLSDMTWHSNWISSLNLWNRDDIWNIPSTKYQKLKPPSDSETVQFSFQ